MRKLKVTAIALCVIILVGVLVGCGTADIPKPTPGEDVTTFEITGSCDMQVEGSTITVTGQTSFMTKTIVYISIVAQSGMEIDSAKIVQKRDEEFEVTFQIDGKYDESVTAITAFLTIAPKEYGKQDDDVLGEYGSQFEKITSETIWNKDGNIVIFSSEIYEF